MDPLAIPADEDLTGSRVAIPAEGGRSPRWASLPGIIWACLSHSPKLSIGERVNRLEAAPLLADRLVDLVRNRLGTRP